jgi:predicted GNAT family acetyltransferase
MLTNIEHNADTHRFEVRLDDHVGYLSYLLKDGVINYNHTIVPKALGGRGIGTELVKYALAYARVNHLKVIPACSFVEAYINKHPEHQDLLAD